MFSRDLVASILMSCWALYAIDCQSWLLNPWNIARITNDANISSPKPSSVELIGPRSGIDSIVTNLSTLESVNWGLSGL